MSGESRGTKTPGGNWDEGKDALSPPQDEKAQDGSPGIPEEEGSGGESSGSRDSDTRVSRRRRGREGREREAEWESSSLPSTLSSTESTRRGLTNGPLLSSREDPEEPATRGEAVEGRGWVLPRDSGATQGITPFGSKVGQGGAIPGKVVGNLSESSRASWDAAVSRGTAPPRMHHPGDMPPPNPVGEEEGVGIQDPVGGAVTTGSSQVPTLVITGKEPPPAQAVEPGLGVSNPGTGTNGGESERPPGEEGAGGEEPMGGGGMEGGLPTMAEPRLLRFRDPSGNRQHAVYHEQEGTTKRPKTAKKGSKKGKGKGKGEAPSLKET